MTPLYISVDLEFTSPEEFIDADILQILERYPFFV